MTGDESDENRTGAPEEFLSRPKWQRFLVFVAGAVFNVVLALLLTWFVLWQYGEPVLDTYPVVGHVVPDSNADRAGFLRGDRVLAIEGRDARDRNTELEEIIMSPNSTKTVLVERDGETLEIEVDTGADTRYRMGFPGWDLIRESSEPPIVAFVAEGERAEAAGLRPGDAVLGLDDEEPVDELTLRKMLAASPERELRLKVRREGRELELSLTPKDLNGQGRIGASFFTEVPRRSLGPGEAVAASVRVNVELSGILFTTLKKLFQRQISVRAFSGPIEIAQFSRQAVTGWETFLSFLAFISLQLGILNLLPIPVLDGGRILILTVEGIMRRDLSDRVKERVMQAGLLFLLAFFGVVFTFDVIKTMFT